MFHSSLLKGSQRRDLKKAYARREATFLSLQTGQALERWGLVERVKYQGEGKSMPSHTWKITSAGVKAAINLIGEEQLS